MPCCKLILNGYIFRIRAVRQRFDFFRRRCLTDALCNLAAHPNRVFMTDRTTERQSAGTCDISNRNGSTEKLRRISPGYPPVPSSRQRAPDRIQTAPGLTAAATIFSQKTTIFVAQNHVYVYTHTHTHKGNCEFTLFLMFFSHKSALYTYTYTYTQRKIRIYAVFNDFRQNSGFIHIHIIKSPASC